MDAGDQNFLVVRSDEDADPTDASSPWDVYNGGNNGPGMCRAAIARHGGSGPGAAPRSIPNNGSKLPGRTDVAYADGHTELIKLDDLWNLKWSLIWPDSVKRPQ